MEWLGPKMIYIERSVTLSSTHRLYNVDLSDEENFKLYGKCFRPNGHGHNYVVKVVVAAPIDPKTNMTIHLSDFGELLNNVLVSPLDHWNLDKDVEFFKTHMSTAENLTVLVW